MDFVSQAGSHASEKGEAFGAGSLVAFRAELGTGFEVGAGDLADFVAAFGTWQRCFAVVLDMGKAEGELAERLDEATSEGPSETDGKQPEGGENH